MLAVLIVLTSLCCSQFASVNTKAMLPASSNGHSLFSLPPYSVRTDIVWSPRENGTTMDYVLDDQLTSQLGHHVPPDKVGDNVHFCFMNKDVSQSSSFVPEHALKASALILPRGHHVPIEIMTGVDTLSDINLALKDLLSDVHPIIPDKVRGTSTPTSFDEEGLLSVFIDGKVVNVPALVASIDNLPHNCQALLGFPAIVDLGILLDEQKLQQGQPLCCYLGEKHLRIWWETNQGQSVDTKPFDIASIDINPDLTPTIIERVHSIIDRYKAVFEGAANTLPKPFDCPPIELQFIPNAKPQSVPEPR